MNRGCKIFKCRRLGAWLCCHDCNETICPSRCPNSPDRCRCCDDTVDVEVTAQANTAFDYDRIIALAMQGDRNKDIAAKIGCSTSTVSRILVASGIRRNKRGDGCG